MLLRLEKRSKWENIKNIKADKFVKLDFDEKSF
jgi:hypothetical protein